MNIANIQNYIENLEQKKFYIYTGIGLGIIALGMLGIIFYHKHTIATIKRDIKRLQQQRVQARELLETHERIKVQQQAVNDLLEKDKSFRILDYFNNLVSALGLKASMEEPALTTNPLEASADYIEVTLTARFKNMTMQQLVELLAEVESNPRIYTKELEITQSSGAILNAALIIATLQPREFVTERAE